MAKSASERKADSLQKKKEEGYKQINFLMTPAAVIHLKALTKAYDLTQAQVLERLLQEAHAKLTEERLIDSLENIVAMKPKKAAIHLLAICGNDPDKVREILTAYIRNKEPDFVFSSKDPGYQKLEKWLKAIMNQARPLSKGKENAENSDP